MAAFNTIRHRQLKLRVISTPGSQSRKKKQSALVDFDWLHGTNMPIVGPNDVRDAFSCNRGVLNSEELHEPETVTGT